MKSIVYNSNSHINKNRKTQWKSLKSIYQDHLDKPETPTPINLTNRFESLHVTEENSAPENKNNYATPKYTIPNDKPKSCHNLWHISEQAHPPIIHKKSVNDANLRPPVVINSYFKNDKILDKLKKSL